MNQKKLSSELQSLVPVDHGENPIEHFPEKVITPDLDMQMELAQMGIPSR